VRSLVAERGLSDRVLLPGRVPHEDVASWIACMDYAVLPNSNHYGSPMKLFEFMGMGVPMVAPDYAPVAEVIADGRTGWLFPRGDAAACVERVLELARLTDERRRVGHAARDYIASERQWRNNAEQLLTLMPAGAAA
jgi:glycosyltransferase involved in cell wall biosynthesis